MSEPHQCAERRNAMPSILKMVGEFDRWDAMPNGDRCCSFCGSLHPDDFKRLVERAAAADDQTWIERSTKGYKWYVHQPGVKNASEGGIKFYTWHLPSEEFTAALNKVVPAAIDRSNAKFKRVIDNVLPPSAAGPAS